MSIHDVLSAIDAEFAPMEQSTQPAHRFWFQQTGQKAHQDETSEGQEENHKSGSKEANRRCAEEKVGSSEESKGVVPAVATALCTSLVVTFLHQEFE